ATLQRLGGVLQRRLDDRPGLADGAGRAREVDDQGAAADPGYAAGQDAERGVVAGLDTDRLRVPGRVPVNDVARGLGRHVVGRQAGAAGGEDEAHVLLGPPGQGELDGLAIVRDGLVRGLEPGLLAQADEL